jgi:hypothetical protein
MGALLAFNAQSTRLAVSSRDGDHVLIFDLSSGGESARLGGLCRVQWLDFLSAEVLLVAHEGGCLRYDLARDRDELLWGDYKTFCAAINPTGRVVAIGDRLGFALYDPVKRRVLREFRSGLGTYARHLAFSTRGRYVAADLTGQETGSPRVVMVWECGSGRRYRTYEIINENVDGLAFPRDTLALAVAAGTHGIQLFEPDRGEDPEVTFELERLQMVCAMRFRNNGRTLTVLFHGGALVHRSVKTGEVVGRAAPPAGRSLLRAAPNADWSQFAAETEGGVFVWPVTGG